MNHLDFLVDNQPSCGIKRGSKGFICRNIRLNITQLSQKMRTPWVYMTALVDLLKVAHKQDYVILHIKSGKNTAAIELSHNQIFKALSTNELIRTNQEWQLSAWTQNLVSLVRSPFFNFKRVSKDGQIFVASVTPAVKEMSVQVYLNSLNDTMWLAALGTIYASDMLHHKAKSIRQMVST